MHNDPDENIARLAASLRRGSVVAAAGYGKTEQIARAVSLSDRRRLILTHTHAGVDAISKRLKIQKVPTGKYRIETIAGWCLKFAVSFPQRSGLTIDAPKSTDEWNAVYLAAAQLLESGAINNILSASYGGVFVDEYQDCTGLQHNVICLLADQLPTCIFGDPLQAIFDFGGQRPVDWATEVFPVFPKEAELATPWRWKNVGNNELADWLKAMRLALESEGTIDLNTPPPSVTWTSMPTNKQLQQPAVMKLCLAAMHDTNNGNLIVIGDGANVNSRAALAKGLSKKGFSNIEPISCKEIYKAASAIQSATGFERFEAILDFICKCMTGAEKTPFENAVKSYLNGGRLGRAKFGDMFSVVDAIIQTGSDEATLALLEIMLERDGTQLYRREMFFAMRSALQIKINRSCGTLTDAIWEVQNHVRHIGRKFTPRSVGSTLLVKGLEFDHAVIVHAANMTKKDWYVALTRATKSLKIISPSCSFTPRI